MQWAIWITLTVHIVAIALWFGAPLGVTSDVRKSLDMSSDAAKAMLGRIARAGRLTAIAGALTIVTGLVIVFLSGGFGAVPPRIHIGLTLTLVMFFIGLGLMRPAWNKVSEAIEGDKLEDAKAGLGKIGAFTGVTHLLWFIMLVLMVFKF